MKNAYIKFLTAEDRAAGFDVLSERSTVIGLDEGIFCVPVGSLAILNELNVCYTLVPYAELGRARRRTWHFALKTIPVIA